MSRINLKRLLLVALTVVFCVSGTCAAQQDILSGDQLTQEEINYKTETVRRGTFERSVSNTVSEYYPLTYPLRYEGANAKFIEYTVSRGDVVKAGDVLARFEITGSAAAMARMELELQRAEEAMEDNVRTREEQIAKKRAAIAAAGSDYEREVMMLELRKLEIELEQYIFRQEYNIEAQKEAVEEVRANYSATELVSPVDGVITEIRYKKLDDAVSTNELLITLYSTDVMLFRVDNGTGSFRYGMPVTVTVGTNKNSTDLTGRVVASDHAIEESGKTGHALIQLDPYDESINLRNPKVKAAMMRLEDVLLVSRKAVTLENGKYYVTKLTDGMVQKRYVVNAESNTTDTWLLAGVTEGETLVLD